MPSGTFPQAANSSEWIAFEATNIGAGERTRTADLLITNQLLYQLSYAGMTLKSMTYEGLGITASRVCQPNDVVPLTRDLGVWGKHERVLILAATMSLL